MQTTLLKFITCGSVDDGKSTLIGHMLYDAKLLYADQQQALELDSRIGSRGGEIDYSLLLDGLQAEREQGITIDVAYRYFTTDRRSFIVADTPGHEEYTRNMAVGASFADLAVILVDATQGLLVQTYRHTRICSLMGIRHFVFAVNKMDLIGYDEGRYREIEQAIHGALPLSDVQTLQIFPVSAVVGDNLLHASANTPWYHGPALLEHLETVEVDDSQEEGFVLPVQRVSRPDHTFRGFQGTVATGAVSVGDEVTVLPSRETAHVKGLHWTDRYADTVSAGQPVTLQLDREVDVSRGCVITRGTELQVAPMFSATMLWMDDQPLIEGRQLLLKLGTCMLPVTVMKLKYRIAVNSGEHLRAQEVVKNELVACDLLATQPLVFDAFSRHRELGHFILIDRVSHATSACGIVEHGLRRSDNLHWQQLDVTRESRAARLGQMPLTLWFTGLSGSGKSTLMNAVERALVAQGRHTMALDGDNVRMGLNRNLGFTEADRIENIRRIAEVAKLMNDAGLLVLTAFISPFEADRERARQIIGPRSFVEIYVSTPLEECERRDTHGLYRKARAGQIPNFTGISSPYEAPAHPSVSIDTTDMSVEDAVERILTFLTDHHLLPDT